MNRGIRIAKRGSASSHTGDSADHLRALDAELPVGAHLITPRRGYSHHGIYVGDGKVVHYAGLCRSLHRGPVEEITLARFAAGHEIWIKPCPCPRFDGREIVRRARSRLGENRYRLLTNNCEHFCEWCLCGQNHSEQVDEWLARPHNALMAAVNSLRQWVGA